MTLSITTAPSIVLQKSTRPLTRHQKVPVLEDVSHIALGLHRDASEQALSIHSPVLGRPAFEVYADATEGPATAITEAERFTDRESCSRSRTGPSRPACHTLICRRARRDSPQLPRLCRMRRDTGPSPDSAQGDLHAIQPWNGSGYTSVALVFGAVP